MVRKAAVLAINKVLDSLQIDSQQTVSSDHSCATALIVQLTHILAAAPHSALATVDMHQVNKVPSLMPTIRSLHLPAPHRESMQLYLQYPRTRIMGVAQWRVQTIASQDTVML